MYWCLTFLSLYFAVPSAAPRNLTLNSSLENPTWISVTWSPMDALEENGVVLEYTIYSCSFNASYPQTFVEESVRSSTDFEEWTSLFCLGKSSHQFPTTFLHCILPYNVNSVKKKKRTNITLFRVGSEIFQKGGEGVKCTKLRARSFYVVSSENGKCWTLRSSTVHSEAFLNE